MSRAKLTEMLSNLGGRLDEFDRSYADKVRNLIMAEQGDSSPMGVARGMTGLVVGSPLTDPITFGLDEHVANNLTEKVVRAGMPATSALVRYGLPTAGLTAAGMGVAELTGQFYDQASNTPVLPM